MMRTVELRFGIATLVAILAQCCPTSARAQSLSEIRELLPDEPPVVWHAQANLDSTPDKEWVVLGENWREDDQPLWIFRKAETEWVKAFECNADYCPFGLELRDLEGDGTLEVVWVSYEDTALTFGLVDFVDGKFRCVWGPYIFDAWSGGLFDIDGDRTLEWVVGGTPPGYLTALFPDRQIYPWWDERSTGERDILIYRFVEAEPVIYFPPLAAVAEGIKRGLVSGYRGSRLAAAEAAGILGVSEALPRLLALLRDPDDWVAGRAAEALAQIGGPFAVAGLIDALDDDRSGVAEQAANALAGLEDEGAASAVLQLRNSDDPHMRCVVVPVLARRGGPEAVQTLCHYLQDEEEQVREAAAQALQSLGGPEVADALAEMLQRSTGDARVQAARTLAALGDPRAASTLIALIEQGKANHRDLLLLGEIGDKSAVPALVQAVSDEGWYHLHCAAAKALGMIGSSDAIPGLVAALEDDRCGERAAVALGMIGSPAALPALTKALSDQHLDVVIAAARSLGMIGSPEAIPVLLGLLEHGFGPCRQAAVAGLAEIGDPHAIPALRKAAAGPIPQVAEAAQWSLVELGAPEALSILLEFSRAGDSQATLRLAGMEGEEVRKELLRVLRENHPEASRWGETMGEDGRWVPGDEGWFRMAAHRLGKAAVRILISRLDEVEGSVAVAAAHCLRELGAVEAIPALLKVADSHPNETAREVARWSVVALRRQGAKWREPLFPEIKQQPLEAYLEAGGPWRVVDFVVGNFDSDPEAEFVIAYRAAYPDAPETLVEGIMGLDWRNGQYVSTESLECEVSHTDPLQVRDVQNDGVPEVIVEGVNGHFLVLAIYGWRDGGLRLLGWFEGYKAGQLLADLDGDNVLEVLSGSHRDETKDLLERLQAEHLHHKASMWELWQWSAEAGEYAQVAGPAAVALFSLGAQDTQSRVRQPCLEALGWLGDEDTVPILIEALSSDDEDIRGAAICSLARIGGSEAAAALRDVAKSDPDEALRSFAQDIVDRWAQGQDAHLLSYDDTLDG